MPVGCDSPETGVEEGGVCGRKGGWQFDESGEGDGGGWDRAESTVGGKWKEVGGRMLVEGGKREVEGNRERECEGEGGKRKAESVNGKMGRIGPMERSDRIRERRSWGIELED